MLSTGRNKLFHRFYEPLVLLYVLDPTQGSHRPRSGADEALGDLSSQELRRRLMGVLAYLCDSDKGGSTFTAIGVTSEPLTYHIASNKTPKPVIVQYLNTMFWSLTCLYEADDEQRNLHEHQIVQRTAQFCESRLKKYKGLLRIAFARYRETTDGVGPISE